MVDAASVVGRGMITPGKIFLGRGPRCRPVRLDRLLGGGRWRPGLCGRIGQAGHPLPHWDGQRNRSLLSEKLQVTARSTANEADRLTEGVSPLNP
jgi:hypothetical protein